MTRREFDRVTKHNYGCPRADRSDYRQARDRWTPPDACEHDYVALRARAHAARNRRQGEAPPTLARATLFRAWAEARRARATQVSPSASQTRVG